ncbi:MAG: DUF4403 family protein [Saprospiraceae bacterium]|nr:DUF4403 family protein [Saprospiraceae bacterium]
MQLHKFLPLMCLLAFCKSAGYTDAPNPGEQYNATEDPAPVPSTLTIPVNISVDDLIRSLNTRLSGAALYEDYNFSDNGNDGLMMNAWKSQDLTMFMSGNTVKYRVPLKLWMKKQLLLGATAEAEGELALNFKTTFNINPDWSLRTFTEVEWHEWISRPVLKTGIGDINVETIANLALNRSKKTLSQTLDQYVSQQISLRPYVQEAWEAIQQPVLLDENYRMWSKTTPLSIGMTPLRTYNNTLSTKIAVECLNDVSFGEKPAFRENSTLPDLRLLDEAPDDFQMHFATDIPFQEAERLAKNSMIGQVFESGKKKVKVEDLALWGNNDRVVVNTRLSGSFKGNIYFIGRPAFNAEKNQIEVKDLDFHVDTRNFLLRSASWIFQGTIKKKMAQSMVFPLAQQIAETKNSLQQTLANYPIQPGITLHGALDSIAVQDTRVTPTGIRVLLFSSGRVNVDVKGL